MSEAEAAAGMCEGEKREEKRVEEQILGGLGRAAAFNLLSPMALTHWDFGGER